VMCYERLAPTSFSCDRVGLFICPRQREATSVFSALTSLVDSFNSRREGEMVSVQMLRDSDLFGELSDEKLEQLARLCREEVYPGRAAIL
jgi:hypothetical protein